jgi:hypothetical protein
MRTVCDLWLERGRRFLPIRECVNVHVFVWLGEWVTESHSDCRTYYRSWETACCCRCELRAQIHFTKYYDSWSQVAERSKAWVCGRSVDGISGSNPAGTWMSVSCECCVLSSTDLCLGLITNPEEPYRVWCVWVWPWSIDNEQALVQ